VGHGSAIVKQIAHFTASQNVIDGKTTAYVCVNYKCNLPTTDVEKMISLLDTL
jgi:uncharacterized protein